MAPVAALPSWPVPGTTPRQAIAAARESRSMGVAILPSKNCMPRLRLSCPD